VPPRARRRLNALEPGTPPAEVARRLLGELGENRERRLLWLAGGARWTLDAARELLSLAAAADVSWLGHRDQPTDPNRRTAGLGGECGLLIVDTWAGLDLDALGAAVGTLRGGGLLLLLSPPPAAWPGLADPSAERFLSFPHDIGSVGTRTLERICRHLRASPAVTALFEPGGPAARLGWTSEAPSTEAERWMSPRDSASIPLFPKKHGGVVGWVKRSGPNTGLKPRRGGTAALVPPYSRAISQTLRSFNRPGAPGEDSQDRQASLQPATADQAEAVEGILSVANADAPVPLVLTADRGRGKSAAMGMAARRLAAQESATILLTAPRRTAAEAVLRHAGKAAPRFMAPDALLREAPRADLLLVDEAAAIPAPLLQAMLARWPRVVFATTVHGYEGTGRGFELRFGRVLDRLAPGWRHLRLRQPIRWAEGDPLERLMDDLLLLDAEPAPDATVTGLGVTSEQERLHVDTLDRERLSRDEALLRDVFGLLVLGHYQTRPSDLRQLLDAPDIAVHALRAGSTVLGVAVTGREGRLPAELHGPIFEGRRRPRGHLLPQTLSAHAGLRDAPALGYWRILRIAVHPAARRRGLGKALVQELAARARADGADLIGASFGATLGLLGFWRAAGCRRSTWAIGATPRAAPMPRWCWPA
jgi:tRNA(Met) cytidine acetyltransferase